MGGCVRSNGPCPRGWAPFTRFFDQRRGRDSNTYMPMDTSRAPIGVMSAKKTFASTHAEWGVETRETVEVQAPARDGSA